jgi:hypothetical protein
MRSRICELSSIGYCLRRIHAIHREIPLSTIRYMVKKEHERLDNQSLPWSGTPYKLLDEQQDHLYNLAVNQDLYLKCRELANQINYCASRNILCCLFWEMHKKEWLQKTRPEI